MNVASINPLAMVASMVAFFAFLFKQYLDDREENE